LLEIPLALTPISPDAIGIIAFATALLLVTFLHVVLGEMVPKNISFSVPTRAALILAPPLVVVAKVFKPIIWTLNGIANGILRLFRVEPKDEATSAYTLDEVANIVEQSTRDGMLTDTSGTLTAAFEFTAKTVADVQVPLADMVLLPETSAPADIQQAVATYGYSRYILTNSVDEPAGYLHLKDVTDLTEAESFYRPVPAKRIRRLASAFAEAELEDALAAMRRTGAHVARVFDAQGRTTGMLFLEDIIEELVGEVQDATSA
jgi:CBS domain containing-hemolysin-like protein